MNVLDPGPKDKYLKKAAEAYLNHDFVPAGLTGKLQYTGPRIADQHPVLWVDKW